MKVSLAERLRTWREFRRHLMLCYAYGGTMPDGRVRVCDKRRGHLDSHTYEFIDVLEARYPVTGFTYQTQQPEPPGRFWDGTDAGPFTRPRWPWA